MLCSLTCSSRLHRHDPTRLLLLEQTKLPRLILKILRQRLKWLHSLFICIAVLVAWTKAFMPPSTPKKRRRRRKKLAHGSVLYHYKAFKYILCFDPPPLPNAGSQLCLRVFLTKAQRHSTTDYSNMDLNLVQRPTILQKTASPELFHNDSTSLPIHDTAILHISFNMTRQVFPSMTQQFTLFLSHDLEYTFALNNGLSDASGSTE